MNARSSLLAVVLLVACDKTTTSVDVVPPPTQLIANSQIGSISIHWQLTPGAAITNYEVQFSTDELNWQSLEKVVPPKVSAIHSNVQFGKKYFYRVRGCTATACSGWIETNAIWDTGSAPYFRFAPGVSNVGVNSAVVTVEVATGGLATHIGVRVFQGDKAVYVTPEFQPVFTRQDTATFATVTLQMPVPMQGTDYTAVVTAYNDAGSIESAPLTFTTAIEGPPRFLKFNLPNRALFSGGSYSISASGTIDPGNNETEVWGEIAPVSASFATATKVPSYTSPLWSKTIAWLSVGITGIQPGAYKYRIVARNALGTTVTDSVLFNVP